MLQVTEVTVTDLHLGRCVIEALHGNLSQEAQVVALHMRSLQNAITTTGRTQNVNGCFEFKGCFQFDCVLLAK